VGAFVPAVDVEAVRGLAVVDAVEGAAADGLASRLRAHGIEASAEDLRRWPYDVALSEGLQERGRQDRPSLH